MNQGKKTLTLKNEKEQKIAEILALQDGESPQVIGILNTVRKLSKGEGMIENIWGTYPKPKYGYYE